MSPVAKRPTNAREVIQLARERGIRIVDFKFIDLLGTWQHTAIPIEALSDNVWVEGTGFDGSSIRGFQEIHESDMMLVPDPTSTVIDPFYTIPTLSFICNVRDPVANSSYSRDPRHIAQKAEAYLKSSGLADVSYWGPELEFFIFDSIRFDQGVNYGFYYVDSDEGVWNSGKEKTLDGARNLGYRPRYKEGYFPVAPIDTLGDIRSEVILKLQDMGVEMEKHHHEVATAGQGEIDMKYTSLTQQADNVMMYKYVLKNVARAHGKVATYMPKPLFGDNGTGMHSHQSLWKDGKPLFAATGGYAGISTMALNYAGGLLHHSPALLAFCAPTTNSYRRLVPGFEAPVNLVYSQRNRSAAVRIPMYSERPEEKRLEYRCPDPSCNPYLAFAAMLMAGIDGVVNKIDPGKPVDKDIYTLPPEEAATIKTVPGSLEEVLKALEEDHDFLLRGGVFTEDVIEHWITYKRTRELDPVRLRPHPYEFHLYFDA